MHQYFAQVLLLDLGRQTLGELGQPSLGGPVTPPAPSKFRYHPQGVAQCIVLDLHAQSLSWATTHFSTLLASSVCHHGI